jgi:hypothetical protein
LFLLLQHLVKLFLVSNHLVNPVTELSEQLAQLGQLILVQIELYDCVVGELPSVSAV